MVQVRFFSECKWTLESADITTQQTILLVDRFPKWLVLSFAGMNLHQTFSLLGHTAVRRHQTLVLRTYSTPRRGLDAKLNMSTWLNLTSSLLARALITDAGCMTERPKLSHNRESPHHADDPAATTHYWLDCRPGGADFFSFFSADWRVDLPFFSFCEGFCRQETFHSHVSIGLPSNRGTVMEMIAFVYLAWLSPFVQQSLFPSSVCVRINQGQKRG